MKPRRTVGVDGLDYALDRKRTGFSIKITFRLNAMIRELHAIGSNLNQIAARASATGHIDKEAFQCEVNWLRRTVLDIREAVIGPKKRVGKASPEHRPLCCMLINSVAKQHAQEGRAKYGKLNSRNRSAGAAQCLPLPKSSWEDSKEPLTQWTLRRGRRLSCHSAPIR